MNSPERFANVFALYDDLEGGGATPNLAFTALVGVACSNFSTGSPLGFLSSSNCAGQTHAVKDNGSGSPKWYANVGIRSGFSTDYTTNTNLTTLITPSFQIVSIDDSLISGESLIPLADPADIFTFPTQEAQSAQCGHSDVHCYMIEGQYTKFGSPTVSANGIFNIEANEISWLGTGNHIGIGWAKLGNDIWWSQTTGVSTQRGIYKFNYANGIGRPVAGFNPATLGPIVPADIIGDKRYNLLQASANFLWVLQINNAVGSAVFKCDHNINLITNYSLGLTGTNTLAGTISPDELTYYVWTATNSATHKLWKLDTTTGVVSLLFSYNIPPQMACQGFPLIGFGNNNMHFLNNEFFLMQGGNTGGGGYTARVAFRR